jgi:N-acetylglucosaminyldiphosphoundecaprenol N-acetyl-beta-D-mannosaminyltransferase
MGMPLDGLTLAEATQRVFDGLAEGRGGTVLTPNIDVMRRHRRSAALQRVFEETELLVPDGTPLLWASQLQGTPLPQRITGTDMLWALTAGAAASGASVFLAGGHPGTAARAAGRLRGVYPGLRIAAIPCYIELGPIGPQIEELAAALLAARPDVVHLGLPFTAQVHVITAMRSRLPGTWFVGVGSSFELISGDRVRAPEWLQRLGLEWAHRIVHEPRVWRRYLIHGLPFAARLGVHSLRMRMLHGAPAARSSGGPERLSVS